METRIFYTQRGGLKTIDSNQVAENNHENYWESTKATNVAE